MENKPKYIISDDTLYEEVENPLYTTYKKFTLPVRSPNPRWTGPKIPFDLWREMTAWCQVTQEKFKSEALCFLFLDLDTPEGLCPWKVWYLPQITNGMTVKADENHKDYTTQRKQFPDLQFGSLHHHCTSGAFASGVDQADEQNREGLHFTLGNIGSKQHSVHYRFCIEGACYEGEAHEVIEYSEDIATVPAKYRDKIHAEMILEPVEHTKWDFTPELENVSKPTYTLPKPYPHQSAYPTRIGGTMNQTTIWEEGGERITVDDIVEFIETEFSITADIGELLEECEYKANFELNKDLTKILKLWNKKYKSPASLERQAELIDQMLYILTGLTYNKRHFTLEKIAKTAIKKWLAEYTNERN